MAQYISPCPLPTVYERELLTILIEECSEVQKRATKALRFGIDECQPGQELSNAQRLGLEIGDVSEMIDQLIEAGVVLISSISEGRLSKRKQLAKFMQTKAPSDEVPHVHFDQHSAREVSTEQLRKINDAGRSSDG